MSDSEFDSVLSSIIIVLLIVVIWKWYSGRSHCRGGATFLACGCRQGYCTCRKVPARQYRRASQCGRREGMVDTCAKTCNMPEIGTPGLEPRVPPESGDYNEMVQAMSLEPAVIESQASYVDGFGFKGLATGASHSTVVDEHSRDPLAPSYHGLSARKFCKARQMVDVSENARTVPTHELREWCGIDMNDLV